MLICALILILFLPAAFLPLALDVFLPENERSKMGIQLEMSEFAN